jgi:hypothetical protein
LVWIQLLKLLGDARNGSINTAVAALDLLPLEAFRELSDEELFVGFLEK